MATLSEVMDSIRQYRAAHFTSIIVTVKLTVIEHQNDLLSVNITWKTSGHAKCGKQTGSSTVEHGTIRSCDRTALYVWIKQHMLPR